MYQWMKRIHTYAGLLSFTALVVWGLTGIRAVFLPVPGEWQPLKVSQQKEIRFEAPGNLDDRDLALRIFSIADIPMSNSPANIRRDEEQNLTFSAYTVNGRWDVTYQEREGLILIEGRRNNLWGFLSSMHAGHSRRGAPDLPARLWGYYIEFSTWAFLFMALSGIYLWLGTRPRLRWAQLLAGGTATLFLILWTITW